MLLEEKMDRLLAERLGAGLKVKGKTEAAYWRARGGLPTSWVVGMRPRLLPPEQIAALEAAVNKRLGLDIRPLQDFEGSAWFPISRQIYADVELDATHRHL